MAKLQKQGLCEANKQIFVSLLPVRIGLITSKNSAAYKDFVNTLKSSQFRFRIYFADSVMQGNQTESAILNALEILEKLKLDIVVLTRGGGSKTDLFSLDNEAISRKIAAYKYPVWTGIGHETDLSILDHISNQYFKTPTAIAEEIISRFTEMKHYLEEVKQRFKSIWPYKIDIDKKFVYKAKIDIQRDTRKLLDYTKSHLRVEANQIFKKVYEKLSNNKAYLNVSHKLIQSVSISLLKNQKEKFNDKTKLFLSNCNRQLSDRNKIFSKIYKRFYFERFYVRIHNEQNYLKNKLAIIKLSDPKMNLKRGFSLVYNNSGTIVKNVRSVGESQIIQIELYDGFIVSTILGTRRK